MYKQLYRFYFSDTYQSATKRLNKLKFNVFAFTTDSETSAKQRKDIQMQQYKQTSLKEILDVPKISDDLTNNGNLNHTGYCILLFKH